MTEFMTLKVVITNKRRKNEFGFLKPVDVCGKRCYVNTAMVIDNHYGGEMQYVTKDMLTDNFANEQAYQVLRSIRDIVGTNRKDCEIISAYFLYKVASVETYSDISLAEILNGSLDIAQPVLEYAQDKVFDEQWQELSTLISKYSCKILCLAAYLAIDDSMIIYSHTTPKSIIDLAKAVLKIDTDDTVADICCGVGGFISSVAVDNPGILIAGYDVDAESVIISSIRADLLGTDIDIQLRNSFELMLSGKTKYKKIFANYPFRLGIQNIGDGRTLKESLKEKYTWIRNNTSSDWLFNALVCELLEEGGMAVAIMTKGALLNRADEAAREYFVSNRLIHSIVLLPEKMLGGMSIPAAMIVFSKKHDHANIRMVDASSRFQAGRRINEFSATDIESILEDVFPHTPGFPDRISFDDTWMQRSRPAEPSMIAGLRWMLSPDRYMGDSRFATTFEVPFYTIIKKITRGAPLTAKELDEISSSEPTDIQYLTNSNIQDGVIASGMPYLKTIKPEYRRYCLKNNCFIVTKNSPFKFAVVKVEEGKTILANGNLYIIELDEEQINPYYLQAYFNDSLGLQSLQNITSGTTLQSLSVDNIKNLEIDVPPLENQQEIADAYKAKLDEIALLKLRLEKARGELNSVYWDNFETIYAPEC